MSDLCGRKEAAGADVKKIGYHISDIPKGVFGEVQKIIEEVHEVADADKQGVKVMVLVELSDLVGSIIGYLKQKYPDTTIEDLIKMAAVTQRAFESGDRLEPAAVTAENRRIVCNKLNEIKTAMVKKAMDPRQTVEPPFFTSREWNPPRTE